MKQKPYSQPPVKRQTYAALRDAFARLNPCVTIDNKGYVRDWQDTLLPKVLPKDFEHDLRAGDGDELQRKFCAVHSSSGLAVNCFSPFRQQIADLTLPKNGPFETLRFEQRCPTGLRGTPPNLDVLLTGPNGVVGIESKLTEHLAPHTAEFSSAYARQIRDARRKQGFFREMERLKEPAEEGYVWLDAAQLIKHAFGLAHTYRDQPVTLLYLFWEPANPEASPEFAAHRQEIAYFAKQVAGSTPEFRAMSYRELWQHWREVASVPAWLIEHVKQLDARYSVRIEGRSTALPARSKL